MLYYSERKRALMIRKSPKSNQSKSPYYALKFFRPIWPIYADIHGGWHLQIWWRPPCSHSENEAESRILSYWFFSRLHNVPPKCSQSPCIYPIVHKWCIAVIFCTAVELLKRKQLILTTSRLYLGESRDTRMAFPNSYDVIGKVRARHVQTGHLHGFGQAWAWAHSQTKTCKVFLTCFVQTWNIAPIL